MQYDWCPYKKKEFGHRHIQREDNVKTQGEDGLLQVKDRGLEQIFPSSPSAELDHASTLISDF